MEHRSTNPVSAKRPSDYAEAAAALLPPVRQSRPRAALPVRSDTARVACATSSAECWAKAAMDLLRNR
eukprot:10690944-Alexandrium_andersonii.AAC.1